MSGFESLPGSHFSFLFLLFPQMSDLFFGVGVEARLDGLLRGKGMEPAARVRVFLLVSAVGAV